MAPGCKFWSAPPLLCGLGQGSESLGSLVSRLENGAGRPQRAVWVRKGHAWDALSSVLGTWQEFPNITTSCSCGAKNWGSAMHAGWLHLPDGLRGLDGKRPPL